MSFQNIKTKPKIMIGVLSPLALLLALGAVSVYSINSMMSSQKWVEHTYNVLAESNKVVAAAVDMETGMRGYLLAGKEEFLDPYKGGEKATYELIDALKETVSDNPGQVARLGEIEQTLKSWQSNVTEPNIDLRHQIGDAKTMNDMAKLIGEAHGKVYFDRFRGQIDTFIAREAVLMDERKIAFQFAQDEVSKLVKAGASTSRINEQIEIMQDSKDWVVHTYEVIAKANDILAAAVDMETGMRGYLLAGKAEFLEPYNNGRIKFETLVADMKETVSDNPAQVTLMTEISENLNSWITNVTEPNIELRHQIGDAKTMDDMADVVGEAKGKIYFDKFRQLIGDFKGEEASLMSVRKAENESMVSFAFTMIGACIVLALFIGFAIAIFIGRAIANPINSMTDSMRTLAKGDTNVEIPGIGRQDEIGDMAEAVKVFKDNKIKADELSELQRLEEEEKAREQQRLKKLISEFERKIVVVLDNLNGADRTMKTAANDVKSTSESTRHESESVASSAIQASANVQTVATSAEELSSSISEISRQVIQSNDVSNHAVSEASETSQQIKVLEENVTRISEVVALINDIADQTNMLAMNATIEAARAGEAGKGFAVVASEVKVLANQTADATEEIKAQIAKVQSSTNSAVGAIDKISGVIGNINEISSSISAAVEEQGAATNEIARNVEEAATGTDSVSTSISDVLHAAEKSDHSADMILQASDALSNETKVLRDEVSSFLRDVQNGDDHKEILEWQDDFNTGNQHIDDEHKVLVGHINTLYSKVKNNLPVSVDDLRAIRFDYAEHFAGEEDYMRQINYAGLEEHKREHDHLLEQFAVLENGFANGDSSQAMELLSMLSADWQRHSMGQDQKLAQNVSKLQKAAE